MITAQDSVTAVATPHQVGRLPQQQSFNVTLHFRNTGIPAGSYPQAKIEPPIKNITEIKLHAYYIKAASKPNEAIAIRLMPKRGGGGTLPHTRSNWPNSANWFVLPAGDNVAALFPTHLHWPFAYFRGGTGEIDTLELQVRDDTGVDLGYADMVLFLEVTTLTWHS